MAYQEHDDTAYAADIDGPARSASSSPTTASFRRQRSSRNHDFGLYANRMRHHYPMTKHDDTASDVEPLDFIDETQSSAIGSPHHIQSRHGQQGHSRSDHSASSRTTTTGRALLGSPRSITHTQSPKNKFDFDDSFDEAHKAHFSSHKNSKHSKYSSNTSDNDIADREVSPESSPTTQSFTSPVSPISPRWASLVNTGSNNSYSYSSSTTTATAITTSTVSVPVSSLHTSFASTGFSTAPTSPISPNPSIFSAKPIRRSPSTSSSSAPRFAGLSSHPFIPRDPTPQRTSSSTEESATLAVESRADALHPQTPFIASAFTPPPPPPAPPRSALRTPTPPLSGPPTAMIIGNFSRPRQMSIKQPMRDGAPSTTTSAVRLRQPEPLQLEVPAPAASAISSQPSWAGGRPRGLSISSNQSSSTYSSSIAQKPSNDHLGPARLASSSTAPNVTITSPGLSRPPLAYRRTDSIERNNSAGATVPPTASSTASTLTPSQSLPHLREHPGLKVDEDGRSSFRSGSASTAQKTVFTDVSTARSSFMTGSSSRASLAWFTNAAAGADEGLSVDDVMGMYERGFGDSTGAEDNDGPYGGGHDAKDSGDDDLSDGEGHSGFTSRQDTHDTHGTHASDTIGSQMLEAMSEALPIPSRGTQQQGAADNAAPRPVRYSGLSSSVPKDSGLALATQHMNNKNKKLLTPSRDDLDDTKEKRDSAKMLDSDDKAATLSPLPSPQLMTPQDSRPSSSKAPSLFARAHTEPDDPAMRDRYGFRKHNQYISREQYDAWNGPYTEYIGRRRRKWVQYLRDSGMITDKPTRFPAPSVKTKRFIRKGIPPEWRGAAWFYYAGGPSIVAKHPGIYDKLISRAGRGEAKEVDIESIERDLHRTFPDNVKFQFTGSSQPGHGDDKPSDGASKMKFDITVDRAEEPKIVSKLRRVLLAFSIYNPRIGYCQSLNFLAGLLLLFVETEEHCFWLLNVITRIFLPGTHEMSLEGSKVDLGVLMAALQDSLPGVWAKIGGELEDGAPPVMEPPKQGTIGRKMKLPKMGGRAPDPLTASSAERLPPITLCMTAWFMSCFIGTLPIETTLRVWDIFFYEGSKTLFRIALAIFKLGEPEIRAVTDPMEMFGVVQAFPRRLLDANMLMEATFRRRNGFGHLSQESIEEKRREHRDAFKEVPNPPASVSNSPIVESTPGREVMDSSQHGDAANAAVRRKGTLFGRRRERRPTEVA